MSLLTFSSGIDIKAKSIVREIALNKMGKKKAEHLVRRLKDNPFNFNNLTIYLKVRAEIIRLKNNT